MSGGLPSVRRMLIDCDSCTARPRACGDCIVTHLLSVGPATGHAPHDSYGGPDRVEGADRVDDADPWDGPAGADLTPSEIAAVGVLAAGGLVPPLRLVTSEEPSVMTRETRSRPRRRGLGTGSQAG